MNRLERVVEILAEYGQLIQAKNETDSDSIREDSQSEPAVQTRAEAKGKADFTANGSKEQ